MELPNFTYSPEEQARRIEAYKALRLRLTLADLNDPPTPLPLEEARGDLHVGAESLLEFTLFLAQEVERLREEAIDLKAVKAGVDHYVTETREAIAYTEKRWRDKADTSGASRGLYNLRLDIARFTAEAHGLPLPQRLPPLATETAVLPGTEAGA